MYGHVALGFRAPLPPKPKLVDHKHINGEVHTDATPVPEATTKPETTDVKEGEPADKHEGPAPELVSIIVLFCTCERSMCCISTLACLVCVTCTCMQ